MSSTRFFYRNEIISRSSNRSLSQPSLKSIFHHKSLLQNHYRSLIISSSRCAPLSSSYSNSHKNIQTINHSRSLILYNKSCFCTKPSPTDEEKEKEKEAEKEAEEKEWEYREVDDENLKKRNYQILSWRVVIGTIIVFGIGTIIFQQQVHKHRQKQKEPQYASYGEAQIGGGEWKMMDHNKQEIDQTTLIGKYQIVYFGFTFCPDVCPRELTKMAKAMHLLEERGYKIGDDILPVFVSVDPKRDTPELVKKYIRQFHPKIYGLTGSPEQTAKFAKAYKAYFSTPGPGENSEDYIVDHVTMMYVMDRQGQYVGHISTLENADEMANKIASLIKDVGHSGGFLGKWFTDPTQLIDKNKNK